MDQLISAHSATLTIGLFVSIGIFGALKAGQLVERSNVFQGIHDLELDKLKLKTESKLELLCKQYDNSNETLQLPEPGEQHFKEIVEKAFLIDESVREPILGLTKIDFDLKNNGTNSSYFFSILDAYGNFLGGLSSLLGKFFGYALSSTFFISSSCVCRRCS